MNRLIIEGNSVYEIDDDWDDDGEIRKIREDTAERGIPGITLEKKVPEKMKY